LFLRCQERAHEHDIACLAANEPSQLASGDHGGIILVWNLVSLVMLCRLRAP
jgi:hypothetical protein